MSAPVCYYSVRQYLQSCTSLQARIDALENIINNMMAALSSASIGEFDEYKFDDGQTRIEVTYTNPESLSKVINEMQALQDKLRARLFNNTNGRVTRMMPGENFIGPLYGNF